VLVAASLLKSKREKKKTRKKMQAILKERIRGGNLEHSDGVSECYFS